MALVGKIREKSGLLVFIVGLGLLLFIIPFDTIFQGLQGSGEQPIGEVNGEKVYDSDWNFNLRAQNMFAGYSNIPEEYKIQQETQLWNQMIIDTLLKIEVEKIGLRVSATELKDYLILGDYPNQQLVEQFSYSYGNSEEKIFSKDSVKAWYDRMNNQVATLTGDQLAIQKSEIYRNIDLPFMEARIKQKYNAMAMYSVIATNSEATKSLIAKNAALDISFVAKDVNTVPNDSVEVTDNEIKSYYEKNKNNKEWRMIDEYRAFDYVLIPIKPTEQDKELLSADLEKVKIAFQKASNDSSFVNANSETKIGAKQQDQNNFDVMPANEFDKFQSPFSADVNEQIANANKGDVVGPFSFTNQQGESKIILAKIRDSYTREETEVRHILIGTSTNGLVEGENDAEIAEKKKLADSLVNVLKADNSKFAQLATQFTDDKQGFAMNKGYYNVYPEAGLVQEFKDFALNNPVGAIQSVKTQFGYHVMEVTQKGEFKHNYLAMVDKSVKPSKDTKMAVFEIEGLEVMEKAEQNKLDAVAEEKGLDVVKGQMVLTNPYLQEVGYISTFAEWSFNEERKVGDVSTPIETKDGNYLVAKMTAVATYGIPTFEAVKEMMKDELLKEKKVKYLANKVKNVKSVEEAAQILTNSTNVSENTIKLSMDAFPGVSSDVTAIAKTFLLKDNLNTVNVIEGKQGVYVVVIKNANITPAPAEIADEKSLLTTKRQNFVESNLVNSLLKTADVRDYRMKAKITYATRDN